MLSALDGQEIEPLTLKIILLYYILGQTDDYISDCCNWRGIAESLVNECGLAVEYRDGTAHFYNAFIREGRTFLDNVIQVHVTENYCRPWKDNEVNLSERELREKKVLESMGLPF